jgi:hypothetical protein
MYQGIVGLQPINFLSGCEMLAFAALIFAEVSFEILLWYENCARTHDYLDC